MANFTFELVLGEDQETYDNLRAALPAGTNNLARGLVVPAHPQNQPQTFKISNLTAGVSYTVDFEGEWQTPPRPRISFIPIGTSQNITVALPYGPVSVTVRDMWGDYRRFLLSVVNYATLFRSYARDITEYSKIPLQQIEESIASPLSYRLATPMLSGLTSLIPADLEILASLAHKLLVKNFLHEPGTLGATTEILAAFSASNPIFYKMLNLNQFDSPLYRSEEVFQGYEAHIWLPNREVERWKAFIQLLNNLPQLYTLRQITEGEVYVQQGGKMRRHLFDFDSPLANSITTGLAYLTDCFLRLFTLTVTVESEHYLAFCQASYILDQLMTSYLLPTDADPLAITPWTDFSLSGRFAQQYDITPDGHEWYYDSPLIGAVDGSNRFFRLSKFPISTAAVKVFTDGLLKRLYIDYRVSLSGNIISSAYRLLSMPLGPLLVSIELGEPRPFLAPVFSSFECRGGADLQMLLTGVEQGLSNVAFVISHPPVTDPIDPQAISIHFVTPILPNSGSPGENQYGQIAMTAGDSFYDLVFNQPTLSIDYQLFISLAVDPMPSSDPTLVQQVFHIVRERSLTGATIEFSAPLAADVKLNWWVVEDDSLTLERGTLLLTDSMSSIPIVFAGGPYFDQVVVLLQLWEINPIFIDAAQYLVSSTSISPGGTVVHFSAPIKGNNYRLDYAIFPARGGDFVEFFEPPLGLVEAHYDVKWASWINAALSPSPDGIKKVFTLPMTCADPKSVYLAIDGRLLTQGAQNQYTVEGSTVTFTFPPTYNQSLWAVYPVTLPGQTLPSAWDQGFLNYLPENCGEYATGWIRAEDKIALGDTFSLDGLRFEAVNPAIGLITNGNLIGVGSAVTWAVQGVTLTGVPDATIPKGTITTSGIISAGSTVTWSSWEVTLTASATPTSEDEFLVGVSQIADAASLRDAINAHSILHFHYQATTGGIGIVAIQSDDSGGFETLITTGSLTATVIRPDENSFTVGQSQEADTLSLIAAINAHTILSPHFFASGISGFIFLRAKELGGGFYNDTLSTIGGTLTVTNIIGDSAPSSYNAYTIYHGEHIVSIADNQVDTSANTFYHMDHPYYEGLGVKAEPSSISLEISTTVGLPTIDTLSTLGLTSGLLVSGTGIPSGAYILTIDSTIQFTISADATSTEVDTLALISGLLPAPLAASTLYYIVNPTSDTFQLALAPYETAVDLTTTGIGYHTFTSQDVEVETSTFAFPTTTISITGTLSLNSSAITSILPTTASLRAGMSLVGTNIPINAIIKSIDSLNQITMNIEATGALVGTTITATNVFIPNEPVSFITHGILPTGLVENQKYYAINITQNRFQVSEVVNGLPFIFTTHGTGDFTIYSIPRFVGGNSQSLDTIALATEIEKHPITSAKVVTTIVDEAINVTAKEVGVRGNFSLAVTGSSMAVQGLSAGRDPATKPIYATSKICYYYDAPVTTLDGLSTRWWKQYEGDKFIFDSTPTLQQEAYYISEVFPIDHHPLDSTVANLPCNYPKGLFTQGFGTHFNETEILVDQEGTMVISTANLPVQERPAGVVNGINTIFTLTLESCAGQNSMMLWLDGVFQPTDKYVYTDMGSYGKITFLTPPAVGQELWAWYLPLGSACVDERVNALVGSIDGINQTFDIPYLPDAPMVDGPTLVTFLEGLFVLQDQDYSVLAGNTQIQFTSITPAIGQSLWAHYNLGSIVPVDNWRQVLVALTDGIADTFMIPHILLSELPTSVDSVLVFLNGVYQGGHFSIEVDGFGNPTGNIIFTDGAPEENRRLEVAYIRN